MTVLPATRFGCSATKAAPALKFGFASGFAAPASAPSPQAAPAHTWQGLQLPSLSALPSLPSPHLPALHLPWQSQAAAPPAPVSTRPASPVAAQTSVAPSAPPPKAPPPPAPEVMFVEKRPPGAAPVQLSAQQMAQMQAVWAAQQAQLAEAAQAALRQAYAKHQQDALQESMSYRLQHEGGMPAEIANNSALMRYNPFMMSPIAAYQNYQADRQAGVSIPLLAPEFKNPAFYRQAYFPPALPAPTATAASA